MGSKGGETESVRMAVATKHEIVLKTERYLGRSRTKFAKMVKKYGDSSKDVLDHCVAEDLMTGAQRQLIDAHYGTQVRAILDGLKRPLKNMHKTNASLNLWVVLGGAAGAPRVLWDRRDDMIDVVILTSGPRSSEVDEDREEGLLAKLVEGTDPGYAKGLASLHERIGTVLAKAKSRIEKS